MAKLSDLVSALTVTGLDERSLKETARRLRDAGSVKKGVGGRYGGAEMDASDCAVFLLALIGAGDTRDVIRAADTVSLVGGMTFRQTYDPQKGRNDAAKVDFAPFGELLGLDKEHTFLDAVAALIAAAGRRGYQVLSEEPLIVLIKATLTVERPWPRGSIRLDFLMDGQAHDLEAFYYHPIESTLAQTPAPLDELDVAFEGPRLAYTTQRSAHTSTILALAAAIAETSK